MVNYCVDIDHICLEITTFEVVLQCLSWPNKAIIKYSSFFFILVQFTISRGDKINEK